ncbi:hypothetical protein [Paenibacillus naphthalenovorans]|uniref:hypothetical protein n=1 Tax=Paenibacillus naphthalenovorans TaxID=162209 RepID=UPI003D286832
MTAEEKKQKRKEYLRNYMQGWRKKNPQRNVEIQANYWARRLAKQAQQSNV